MIDIYKPCIRLYAVSSTNGHTTAEVFVQQDVAGDFQYFHLNGSVDGRSPVHASIKLPLKEVKGFQLTAVYQDKWRANETQSN